MLFVGRQAKELTTLVYTLFKTNTDYGFKDQIQRASVSIMNNIAEGFDRNQTKNSFSFYTLQKAHAVRSGQCFTLVKSWVILMKQILKTSINFQLKLLKQFQVS